MTVELTAKQLEVLKLVADGLLTKQIAGKLGLSPRTVEAHRDSASKKLGALTSAHAVAIALRDGLIT